MSLVNSQGPLPGLDFSSPDVYLQVTPAGEVPIPFISMGMRATEIPKCTKVLTQCMPPHTVMDQAPVTVSGPGRGAVSSQVCSTSKSMKGSTKLILQNVPATRALMDPTGQNGGLPNSLGNTIAPSQIRMVNPSP